MELDQVMIEPDKRAIQAELAKLRKRLERRPDSWARLEQVGRCLRWLDDPEAKDYFRQATANYKIREQDPGDHMRLGNLHRFGGEAEAAQSHFKRARALYAPRAQRQDPNPLDVEHMIPASFLTGRDDEVADLIACLQTIDQDTELIAYPIAKLAEARRTQKASLAAEAVADLAAIIPRERAQVWNSGGVLPWDWYEIAVEIWRRLSRGDSE
jgi:hypothetical protein